jgi:hypothetical protein
MKGNRVPLHPLGSEHDAKWKMHVFENGPLFDVQLQVSSCVVAFSNGITNPFDVNVTVTKGVLKANPIAVHANTVDGDSVGSGKCGRTEEAPSEACALLIGPIN